MRSDDEERAHCMAVAKRTYIEGMTESDLADLIARERAAARDDAAKCTCGDCVQRRQRAALGKEQG